VASIQKAKKSKANVKIDPGLKQFLETQENLLEDYLGTARGKRREKKKCACTLVRGPNDQLFLVSETKVKQVKDQDQVNQFLEDLNDLVEEYLAHIDPRLITGPGVHVGTAEIFPK
jgi:hypothetical protein